MPVSALPTPDNAELASLSGTSSGSREKRRAKSAWRHEPHMYVIFLLVFVTALAIFGALRMAGEYYFADLAQRPQHPLHESFKPSGVVGQGFGVVGGLFCMLTLLYPLRKRLRVLENVGTPRTWFQFHIYFGIAGPLLATLHSTLKFTGIASICYWSMMLVMASGFIGRFLFAQLPRNQRGVLLSLKEIDAEIKVVQRHLESAGMSPEPAATKAAPQGKPASWRTLFQLWRERRRALRTWQQRVRKQGISVSMTRRILSLLARKLFLESSRFTLALTTRAFSHWHTLHLPFTYLMFITLLVHAGLAILLGYTWIF